jgi:hypothetical protein
MRHRLAEPGWEVVEASSGEEPLELRDEAFGGDTSRPSPQIFVRSGRRSRLSRASSRSASASLSQAIQTTSHEPIHAVTCSTSIVDGR